MRFIDFTSSPPRLPTTSQNQVLRQSLLEPMNFMLNGILDIQILFGTSQDDARLFILGFRLD
jgi:hypothetical protein